jgi:hypothetical protein
LALNASIADVRNATDSHRTRTEAAPLGVDRRLAELAAAIGERYARQRYLELLVTNRSLEQCRRSNAELVADLRAAELVEKVAGIERLLGEQSVNNIRLVTNICERLRSFIYLLIYIKHLTPERL